MIALVWAITPLADRVLEDALARHIADDPSSGARGAPTCFVGERRHQCRFDAHALIPAREHESRI